MFNGNIVISGGHFTQAGSVVNGPNSARDEAFKLLQQQVAATAFHNSAQRIDPPRCHRDTRVAVMDTIYDWIVQSADREQWLLWLNGAVGAGKSAVMQSLAERCVQAAIAVASFFFSRADSTRNTITPLVATLAYQLIQAIPETLGDVLLTIEHNPLIFVQSLESQLQGLIIQPLLRLPRHLQRLFVLFIDGLDECNDRLSQSYLINILGDVSRNRNIPVVFLVAGRREAQIEAAFRQDPVANLLRTLSLDEISASDDIRRFLNNKFSEIKATHLRKHLLAADWPPMSVIGELVAKSSGQFIFASVVINYISSPAPILRLNLKLSVASVCEMRLHRIRLRFWTPSTSTYFRRSKPLTWLSTS
ncbi:hypothetical protein BJ912DRAFT_29625 [Pholiota molesta]|nr:hypothetical protein BJ912DRAFT_29625 [Pholiota molesta]